MGRSLSSSTRCSLASASFSPPSSLPKVALVTGASRGIGKFIAQMLADNGYRVVIVSQRADGAQVASDLAGEGPPCLSILSYLNQFTRLSVH